MLTEFITHLVEEIITKDAKNDVIQTKDEDAKSTNMNKLFREELSKSISSNTSLSSSMSMMTLFNAMSPIITNVRNSI